MKPLNERHFDKRLRPEEADFIYEALTHIIRDDPLMQDPVFLIDNDFIRVNMIEEIPTEEVSMTIAFQLHCVNVDKNQPMSILLILEKTRLWHALRGSAGHYAVISTDFHETSEDGNIRFGVYYANGAIFLGGHNGLWRQGWRNQAVVSDNIILTPAKPTKVSPSRVLHLSRTKKP